MNPTTKRDPRRGSTIIEFALITLLLMIVIFAGFEFDRMVLAYTSIANSAKVGLRYAIVHGSDRSGGSGSDGQSGGCSSVTPSCAADASQVATVVRNFASTGLLNTAAVQVDVQYPASNGGTDRGNSPGSTVIVRVTYPYDPFVMLPLHVNLTSSAQGVIVY